MKWFARFATQRTPIPRHPRFHPRLGASQCQTMYQVNWDSLAPRPLPPMDHQYPHRIREGTGSLLQSLSKYRVDAEVMTWPLPNLKEVSTEVGVLYGNNFMLEMVRNRSGCSPLLPKCYPAGTEIIRPLPFKPLECLTWSVCDEVRGIVGEDIWNAKCDTRSAFMLCRAAAH